MRNKTDQSLKSLPDCADQFEQILLYFLQKLARAKAIVNTQNFDLRPLFSIGPTDRLPLI